MKPGRRESSDITSRHDPRDHPAKALHNSRKHDVTFDRAATVFLDAFALTVYDELNSQNEDRWFTLGYYDAGGRLLAVAHTYEVTGSNNVRCALFQPARPQEANDILMRTSRDR